MKLKIIFPANDRLVSQRLKAAPAPPLSLEYLAGLAPSDAEVELVDMGQGDDPGCDDAEEGEVDLAALHVRTPVATTAFRIADRFRARGIKVAMGGPHPTLLPAECKAHCDAVCIGEGEKAWPAMLEDLAAGDLRDYYIGGPFATAGLKGRTRKFPSRPNLRNLSWPRRGLFSEGRYALSGVFVSRGCPYDCKFCSVRNLQGATVRLRPEEEVLEEISGIKGPYFSPRRTQRASPPKATTSSACSKEWRG